MLGPCGAARLRLRLDDHCGRHVGVVAAQDSGRAGLIEGERVARAVAEVGGRFERVGLGEVIRLVQRAWIRNVTVVPTLMVVCDGKISKLR